MFESRDALGRIIDAKETQLTLRDQFAIGALSATRTIYANWPLHSNFENYAEEMVKHAYVIADMMLAEREKNNA